MKHHIHKRRDTPSSYIIGGLILVAFAMYQVYEGRLIGMLKGNFNTVDNPVFFWLVIISMVLGGIILVLMGFKKLRAK